MYEEMANWYSSTYLPNKFKMEKQQTEMMEQIV